MAIKLLIIAVIIIVGIFVSATGIGSGSGIMSFFAAFGLFMIIIFVGFILFAKNQKK